MKVSIKNTTKQAVPRIQFDKIKDKVLGERYELSLVFCGNKLSRELNRIYRHKDKVANVLSFPLSKSSGEIFINLSKTNAFKPIHLYIHALLHLKGMSHGHRMEQVEKKLLNGTSNRSWD